MLFNFNFYGHTFTDCKLRRKKISVGKDNDSAEALSRATRGELEKPKRVA